MADQPNTRTPDLPEGGIPQPGRLLPVYNPLNDLTEKVLVDHFLVTAPSQNFQYDPGRVYAINEFVTFNGLGWLSQSNGNQGNEPFDESTFWEDINLSMSGFVEWAAGAYTQNIVIVLSDHSGVTQFYELLDPARPYISTDIVAEEIAGDWRSIGSGVETFGADFVVSLTGGKTFGKYTNGQTVPATGLTPRQLLLDIAIEYLPPAFLTFLIVGQAQTIEQGASIASGMKTFNWSTSNPGNINPNSIVIRDQTAAVDLATGLADDGTEAVNLPGPIQLVNEGDIQTFRISGVNTLLGSFIRDFVITADALRFYGVSPVVPDDSAEVRALPSNTFNSVFSISIPQGQTIIVIAYEAVRPDLLNSSVIYVEGFNASIGNTFTKYTFNVNDANATPRAYKIFVQQLGVAYPADATYNVTIP